MLACVSAFFRRGMRVWSRFRCSRIKRSVVESLVYTFRFKFHVHRFSRRGLAGVRSEMIEKVVAHNCWRAATLRKRASALEPPTLL